MPAAAKRTLFLAVSLLALVAVSVVGAAGGAPPDKDREAPSAPKNLRVSEVTQTLVRLAWDPSSDNVAVAGYYVFGDRRKAMLDTALDKPEYTLDRLSCGQSSTLTIIAFDDSQNRSEKATMIVSSAPCTDTLPPATPAGFRQVATSDDAVVLAWNPSADNVGVVGYGVYRNLQRVASPSDPTVPLAGLACGSSYDYAVDAVDAAGNRSSLAKAYVQTSACASSPEPPAPTPSPDTQAPSTPSGLAASSITQSALTLSWNLSTDNVQVTGYDLYRDGTKVASPASPGASQSGLACGTSYAFAVEALDAAGNRSSRATLTTSTSACSTTIPPPPPPSTDTQAPSMPTGLRVSSATPTSASLSWNPSTDNVAVEGYRSYRDGAYQATGSQPAATISGLSCGTAYTFAVDAFDAEGNASNRASVIGSTLACPDTQAPSTPAGVVASSRTATSIALTWSASSDNIGVSGYGLYRGGSLVGTGTTTTGIFAGLTCNTNYTLGVDAVDAAGNRSPKTTVMVSTIACPDTTPPSAPANLTVSGVTQTSLTFGWNAASDNVGVAGYDVYRNNTKMATLTSNSSNQTALVCGTPYTLAVEAFDAAGNRSARAQLNATTAVCSAPPPPPPSPPDTVIWRADGSMGTDPAYIIEQEWSAISDDSAGGSAEITAPWTHPDMYLTSATGDVLAGKRSYRVKAPAGEGRHEIKMAHPVRSGYDSRVFHEGEETWISWAVKIADYVHPPSGQWMVNQFRHVNETGLTSGGSPHGLAMRSPANWQWVSDPAIYTNALNTYDMGVPIVEGQVLKITFHAKWSSDPAIGFMEVFLNNGSGWVTGFPKRFQSTLLFNSTSGRSGRNHMRFGAYRTNVAGTIDDAPADSYMAGLVCASTREAAEHAAFG